MSSFLQKFYFKNTVHTF